MITFYNLSINTNNDNNNLVTQSPCVRATKIVSIYSTVMPQSWCTDARADALVRTFSQPSGLGATCVLRSAFNSSFDYDVIGVSDVTGRLSVTGHQDTRDVTTRQGFGDVMGHQSNSTRRRDVRLVRRYFEAACESVFVGSLPLANFVPPSALLDPPDASLNETNAFFGDPYD